MKRVNIENEIREIESISKHDARTAQAILDCALARKNGIHMVLLLPGRRQPHCVSGLSRITEGYQGRGQDQHHQPHRQRQLHECGARVH